MVTVVVERPPTGSPQAGDDLELLVSRSNRFQRRERDAVGPVLGLVPAGAEAELHPPAGHLVDLRHLDREQAGPAEGRRGHEGAQPDPAGVAGQARKRGPRVGRAGQPVAEHAR